jgi:hemerythrin-like domain-containing protein
VKAFGDEIYEHIEYEEKTLLPVFAEEGGETEGATLEIFLSEHRKLREQADKLIAKTQVLFASTDLMGSIIALMDDEALFKGLFHHHALREKNLLFPRLDERTTEEQRERLLALKDATACRPLIRPKRVRDPSDGDRIEMNLEFRIRSPSLNS